MNEQRVVYLKRNDELYHHGVKGQKWGVRRYQNEDGSYKSGAEGRYNENGTPTKTSKERKHLTSGHKKAIAIGVGAVAAVGVGALAIHYSKQMKAGKAAIIQTAKNTPLKSISEKSISTGKDAVKRIEIPKTEINRVQINRTPINRVELNRTPINRTSPSLTLNPGTSGVSNDQIRKNIQSAVNISNEQLRRAQLKW